ncbi:hypothetical protein [Streptomyces sp. NPDC047315]|uniref:hypothetical protein n=1 Tax=Streptomyces sp. NPDC047315 TaxID=3155142 RepID=UPI0033C1AB42
MPKQPPAPVLTVAAVTVTTDQTGHAYAIVPDDVARLLTAISYEGIDRKARGIFFDSTRQPATSWAATTVRTIFEAVLASPVAAEDPHARGLSQYRKHDGGTFYGLIAAESAWDPDTRWWTDHRKYDHLIPRGTACIEYTGRRGLAGTCWFSS